MKAVTIIQDLHLTGDNSLTQPFRQQEQRELLNKIHEIALKNRAEYEESYLIFAGDICDRTVQEPMFTELVLYFTELDKLVDGTYAVIGNHETSYKLKGNLFWNLAYGKNIPVSTKFHKYRDVFKADDYFDVDDVRIKLWGHNQEWKQEDLSSIEDLVVVGHNSVNFDGMREVFANVGMDIQEKFVKFKDLKTTIRNADKLRAIFLGHMHSLVGRFKVDEKINGVHAQFILENMGSLIRTKSTEFGITNIRNIPTLEIDGTLKGIKNNLIELSDASSLDSLVVEAQKENYKASKYIKQMKLARYSSTDVIKDIERLYANDLYKLNSFRRALDNETEPDLPKLINFIEKAGIYVQ